jgi:hypothetical protein
VKLKWIKAKLLTLKHYIWNVKHVAKLNSTVLFCILGLLTNILNLSVFHFALFLVLFLAVDITAFNNGLKAEREWTIKLPKQ